MTILSITRKEYDRLKRFTIQTHDAKQLRRVQAVLWVANGEQIPEVAKRLNVSVQTIYNWLRQYNKRQRLPLAERFSDESRSGRPRTAHGIIDPLILEIFDEDPRELEYRSTVWTAPLLRRYLQDAHQISVSEKSVRSAVRRLGLRWKRPRHILALRSATWRQAKGGSNAA